MRIDLTLPLNSTAVSQNQPAHTGSGEIRGPWTGGRLWINSSAAVCQRVLTLLPLPSLPLSPRPHKAHGNRIYLAASQLATKNGEPQRQPTLLPYLFYPFGNEVDSTVRETDDDSDPLVQGV